MSSSGLNLQRYLIPLEEINRATDNFNQQRCIGGGGFGKVYRGELSPRWQNRTAAIKRLDRDGYQGEHEFRNELVMISKFHHKNIISFIGYCDESNEMIIVYEYAMNESLDYHLQDPNKMRFITWTQRLKICIGAARGLRYLHSGLGEHNRVIHRDVKSANILLDGNLVPKVCDFGLSRFGPRNQADTRLYTKVAGTQFYMDPTYHESGILSKESDVYSLGVVLFEMLSGMLVYSRRNIGDNKPQSLINFVRRYYHTELDKIVDPHIKDQIDDLSFKTFKEIAYQCISFNVTERPKMEDVIEKIEEALDIELQKNDVALIEYVMEEVGFSHGKPVAAFTIYKRLLEQKYLEAESTTAFDRLIQIINSAIEVQKNNNQMVYWLSNASTLLFLIEKSLKLDGASSVRLESQSSVSTANLAEAEAEAALMVIQQVELKNPALVFKQQLAEFVEKVYGIICDNLKRDLGSLLGLCILAPSNSVGEDSQLNHWKCIVDSLNTLLKTLNENCVPPIIVQKLFAQVFSYINMQLFNSLLLCPECCTKSNSQYVNEGLSMLELWCSEAKEENVGSAWDELKHIGQVIKFLVTCERQTRSYDGTIDNQNPLLSMEQLCRISTIHWDDNYKTPSGSHTIPFSVDDLCSSMKVKDFANVEPAMKLSKYRTFDFLYN